MDVQRDHRLRRGLGLRWSWLLLLLLSVNGEGNWGGKEGKVTG